jgi:DNA-binding SARP family transcriptional activator
VPAVAALEHVHRDRGELAVDLRVAELRIRLLGDISMDLAGVPLDGFNSPRLQRLVARLVLGREAAQSRARIAYELWPDSTESQARTNLRHLLHDLRRTVPELERFVDITNQTLRWRPDAPVLIDVVAFTDAIARSDLDDAVAHYGGDLLPACYDDWVLAERDRLRATAAEALATLAARAGEAADHGPAVHYARRLVQLDPLHELGYRLLMQAHARRGDRSEALRTYHACVDVLERELGVEPSAPTRQLYEALRVGADQSRLPGAGASDEPASATPPLVGREVEWQQVQATWREAAAGRAQLLLVTGEPGVGKTRLVEELSRRCTAQGIPFARTRLYEAAGRLPWAPVVDWLRAPALSPSVAGLPTVWLAELARLLPELRVGRPDLPEPPAADAALRHRLFDAVTQALVGGPAPLLLVVDDLQWCDPDTIELVGFLLHTAPTAGLLVAGTARAEEIDEQHPLARLRNDLGRAGTLTEIRLERLGAADTAGLAARLSRDELDAPAAERLYQETEGNPLFVVEAVRAGFPADSGTALSPTVRAVITARLDQLSPGARQLVEVAATVGRAFTVDVLALASGAEVDDLVGTLDQLWRRQVIRDLGGTYDFTHDKIREVAHDTISPARRRHLHRAVAEALATTHAADLGVVSAQLAAHYEYAGLPAESVAAHRRAAAQSLLVFAFEEAIASLRNALSQLERLPAGPDRDETELELRIELGVPLVAREGYGSAAAQEVYERAVVLSRRLRRSPSPPVLRGLGLAALVSCRFDRSSRFGAALLDLGDQDPTAQTEGHYLLGVSAFWRGDLAASRAHLSAAIRSYRAEQSAEHITRYAQDPKAVCLVRLALTELWCGKPDRASTLAQEALAFAETLAHPTTHAYVLMYAAFVVAELGDRAPLIEYLDAGDALWARQPLGFFMTLGQLYRGWIEVLDGRPGGIDRLQAAIDGLRAEGQTLHLTYALGLLARARHMAGDIEAGRTALREGVQWGLEHDQRYVESELWRIDGELLAASGDATGAEAAIQRAVAVAASQGARWLELRATCSLARLVPGPAVGERLRAVRSAFADADSTPDVLAANALLATLS